MWNRRRSSVAPAVAANKPVAKKQGACIEKDWRASAGTAYEARLPDVAVLLTSQSSMLKHGLLRLAAGLVVVLLLAACAANQSPPGTPEDKVISRHAFRGTFTGFEIGDYVHPVIRDSAGKRRSFFVDVHGLSYYLALHEGEMLDLEYEIVDTYIEQAAGVVRIERLATATDGRLGAQEWWRAQRRSHTLEQLLAKYESLIDRYTISRYENETPFALKALQGAWRIMASSHCPHVCAMDAKEAARLAGAVLSYSAAAFSNGQVTCASPRFSRRGWTAEQFLGQYRFKAETLGLKRPVIEEFSVRCGDSRVGAPLFGAIVIVKDHRTIFVPWDGVFFEARRE